MKTWRMEIQLRAGQHIWKESEVWECLKSLLQGWQRTHNRNTGRVCGLAIIITYFCLCVHLSSWACVAFRTEHATRMRHTVTCGFSGCATFFDIISKKARFSKKKITEHKMCVLSFPTNLSKTFPILRRIRRDIIINVQTSSCKVSVILARF